MIIEKGDEPGLSMVCLPLLMGTVLSVWMDGGYFVGLTRKSAESFRWFWMLRFTRLLEIKPS